MLSLSEFEQDALHSQLFHHLIDGLQDYAIFVIHRTGKIATWNPGVQRILGYDKDEFIGLPFSRLFTTEDNLTGIPEAELHLAQSEGKAEDERLHVKKDGSTFWASGLVTPMKDGDGKILGFTKIMRDQSERKRYEETLAQQANALAVANRELQGFAGVVSHDLNAPLQTMYGFANILKARTDLDEEAEQSIRQISEGAKRMSQFVSQLLRYSTALERNDELLLVDSGPLLQEVLLSLSVQIEKTSAKITNDSLPQVWADRVQLGRVFQNLIENAIKYRKEGRAPEISVSAEHVDEGVVFAIKDNGRGISSEDMPKIFTLFGRVQERGITGYGIGLSSCRKIVERFGGRIWVESVLGEGSTFFFLIPHKRIETRAPELPQRSVFT
jgi:PAS domain S-box-containing protein